MGVAILGAWAYKVSLDSRVRHSADNSRGLTAPGRRPPESASPPRPESVGRITGTADCRWADPQDAPPAAVPLGRKYDLASGLMEITYQTRGESHPPRALHLRSRFRPRRLPLAGQADGKSGEEGEAEGRGDRGQKSRNPKSEIPNPLSLIPNPLFSVRTPTAVVTDLGTEFGVEVDGTRTTAYVFQGKVAVTIPPGNGSQARTIVLKEHGSLAVNRSGVELSRQTVNGNRFARYVAPSPFLGLVDLSKGTVLFSESFSTDSSTPAIDYPALRFAPATMGTGGGESTAAVVGGVLLLCRKRRRPRRDR